jgi:hypothetical protein
MVWVRSEYAGELGVLLTWLSAVVPWNVTYSPLGRGGGVLFLRFPLFQLRYTRGVTLPPELYNDVALTPNLLFNDVLSVLALQRDPTTGAVAPVFPVWVAGGALFLVAVALSVAYYLREERVEAGPVDPVSLLGGLLALSGATFLLANYLLTRSFPGVPVPLGALLVVGFGGLLLSAERV